MIRCIIAGSRSITDYKVVCEAIEASGFADDITEVVSGCARGVDKLGELWASTRSIPIKRFPADWDKHGKAAGVIRNAEMASYATHLIAIWDGSSRGTRDMISRARDMALTVYVHRVQSRATPLQLPTLPCRDTL